MESNNINTTSSEPVAWPTSTEQTKKKKKLKVVYLVLAILLTIGSALGSFYLSRNLNQASTPNAPESQPAAAGKNQKTENTEKNGCKQGCASDEYCEGTRCRKTGGNADGRTEWEKYVQSIPTAAPTQKGDTYICTSQNCPGPEFHCASANRCESSAGFCNGLRCSGRCVRDGANNYRCETVVTPTATLNTSNDPNNCGTNGHVCPIGRQLCVNGECRPEGGAVSCNGITPDNHDGAGSLRNCCVPGGVGVDPNTGGVDQRVHWTNCAPGTTCRQGVGCIGSPTRTPDRTTNEVTTTTTINPTTSVTTTVTIPPTTTVTIPPTVTATPTGTVTVTGTVTTTPTIAVCNESCSEDDDCSDGLFCDSESNKCRKPECSDEKDCSCPEVTPEPTIVDCNYKCKTDDNCSSGLICDSDSGRCRKAACSDEKDCSCPKPRKTDAPTREVTTRRTTTRTAAQPTVLKEAGILDFPGAAVFGSGLILTVIGILLAL